MEPSLQPRTPRQRSIASSLVVLLLVGIIGGILGGVVLPYYLQIRPAVAPAAPPGTSQAAPQVTHVIETEESAIIKAVEKVRPAVVNVNTLTVTPDIFGQLFPQEGAGSGVIVRPDGYILTNNHVVQNARRITVTLLSGKTLQGRIVGADPFSDLAVIKVDTREPLPAAELGTSSGLRVGQLAIAIGNPFGLGSTVTVGVVSALNRNIQLPNLVVENLIQTDAAINPGNSGGALVDSKGRVIGINTAIIREAQGIGFAIPIDTAKAIMQQLISRGRVARPFVGVEWGGDVDPSIAQAYGLPVDYGVVVRGVVPGSPAEKARIQPGDIIVAINGERVNSWNDFVRIIMNRRVGETVQITIVRGSQRLTVRVTLAERPR
ncbi:MAG: trypsin-like peptidase domain-containing protein [Armatimonadota bacterium]|nr:trypsin-like peptidase domain-containing protein [Armatimonadota bacterium]MDR5702621.1 trypsin-like peptidase domain-containing protein [Armatimonadota bacterium]